MGQEVTIHLPGSSPDRKPLVMCSHCKTKQETSGGVFFGVRFACRGCFRNLGKPAGRCA